MKWTLHRFWLEFQEAAEDAEKQNAAMRRQQQAQQFRRHRKR